MSIPIQDILPNPNNHQPTSELNTATVVDLSNGRHLRSQNALTLLISPTDAEDSSPVIQTWPTGGWNLIAIDSAEKTAVFEAEDSWLLAVLELDSGEWKADHDPLFPRYSLEEDQRGEYLLDHQRMHRTYLRA